MAKSVALPIVSSAEHSAVYRVGLLSVAQQEHELICESFIKNSRAARGARYEVDLFMAQFGNRMMIASCAEKMLVQSSYDIVVSVGCSCSQALSTELAKRKIDIPMVFIGVAAPVENGVVSSLRRPGGMITGVSARPDNPLMPAMILCSLKENVDSVAVLYDGQEQSGVQDAISAALVEYLHKRCVRALRVPLEGVHQVLDRVKSFISQVDTVLVLEGGIMEGAYPGLIKLCNQHAVTLFAGHVEAVAAGAALGFGPDVALSGRMGFELVEKIVTQRIYPGDIPVTFIEHGRKIAINTEACKTQNVDLAPLSARSSHLGKAIEVW